MRKKAQSKQIARYLDTYAETETTLLNNFPQINSERTISIPCYDESPEFLVRLCKLSETIDKHILAIVVVNHPDNKKIPDSNIHTLDWIEAFGKKNWQNHYISLRQVRNFHLLSVDRSRDGPSLPHKQGVGLARKIGADIAACLLHENKICSEWAYSTDADTHIPSNYFSDELNALSEKNSAVIFAYKHMQQSADRSVHEATILYEQALNYYVAGLRWAGSPYAYPTIGSTFVINLNHYCQARGFPRRAGGEDFYLLNKLAKLAPVFQNSKVTVSIESRLSNRAPFGTGPAVKKIIELSQTGKDYCYYSSNCFACLKEWLDFIPQIFSHISEIPPLSEQEILHRTDLRGSTQDALNYLNIESLFSHLRKQAINPSDCNKRTHEWFDAFKTLKFIRFLQEHYFPAEPLPHLLSTAPWSSDC